MFNNVGRCAHIRPIIGCKGNGYKTGSQRIGLSVATMYGFALCALPERFVLHRFAIVFRIPVTRFKSLNSPDWAWVKGFQKGVHEKTRLGGYLKWKNATPDHLLPQAATPLQIHCYKRTTDLLCRQKEEQSVNIISMEVVIISKNKYEEMVGKLNRLSDRVNEILRKREGKRLSRWMDNQDVCQQLRISPRTLQTLRDNGTLAYSQIGHKIFYKPEDVQSIVRLVEDRRKDAAWRGCSI